ncbi:cytochrome c551 [Halobacillus seohaensis]|uniref:Cytochrome c551 n=1 Tax=Halobacillus seohaensis TaxID=447421 RepID=A0ABW2ESE3_9BACI
MKKTLWVILMGMILVLGACGGGGDDETGDGGGGDNGDTANEEGNNNDEETADVDVAAAEEVYEQSCASCHGGDMGGNVGPALTDVGANYSSEEIAKIIHEGKGDMPAQNVEEADAQLLGDWLSTMK